MAHDIRSYFVLNVDGFKDVVQNESIGQVGRGVLSHILSD